jgi:hypothetical protein
MMSIFFDMRGCSFLSNYFLSSGRERPHAGL